MIHSLRILIGVAALGLICIAAPAAAQSSFEQFIQSLWPQAQQLGVSRKTFDAAMRGLEPDLSLPDLDIPGRVEK
ncbi:MAG: lytic murein transglycosylase, partial [Xanthobacteraceae bacterium]